MSIDRPSATGEPGLDGDRGATVIIVALSMTVLIGLCAVAIETGRLWTERRALVTATDAAANAAAGAFGHNGDGCAEAAGYLTVNEPDAIDVACDYFIADHGRGGRVRVKAAATVDYQLGTILGLQSGTPTSSTAVIWGRQIYVGIRPFAFCSVANADLSAWLANPVGTVDVVFSLNSADSVAQCTADGLTAGNWGTVDFDGGSNSTGQIQEWLVDGYPGTLLTSQSTLSCTVDPTACYYGDTGILSTSIITEVQLLMTTGPVPFLIYDRAEGTGSGLQYRITAVTPAEVIGYQLTGAQALRSITMRFHPGLVHDNWDSDASRICGEELADCDGVTP